MAIPEKDFYHGAALAQIVSDSSFTSINAIPVFGTGAYAVNHDIGLYVKHTTAHRTVNRGATTEWSFTFSKDHQKEVRDMFNRYGDKLYIVLVCEDVGICAINYGEYSNALDENWISQEFLKVEKTGGGQFRVRGAKGYMGRAVPLNRFPRVLFA